jgi:hypothetical protein
MSKHYYVGPAVLSDRQRFRVTAFQLLDRMSGVTVG